MRACFYEIKPPISVIPFEPGRRELDLEDSFFFESEKKRMDKEKSNKFWLRGAVSERAITVNSAHRVICLSPPSFIRAAVSCGRRRRPENKQVAGEGWRRPGVKEMSEEMIHKTNIKIKHHEARVDGRKKPAANDGVLQKFSFSLRAWGYREVFRKQEAEVHWCGELVRKQTPVAPLQFGTRALLSIDFCSALHLSGPKAMLWHIIVIATVI